MSKWVWIIGGPNGAGKSTFAGQFLVDLGHRDLLKLNADEKTLELRAAFPDEEQNQINLKAAIEIDKLVECYIDAERSFVVETVLSSDKYRDDILIAKSKGFKIGIIYVSLYPPELAVSRVDVRVQKGGHKVEEAKVIERYFRSHDQLRWFASKADILMMFDNSECSATPILVASWVKDEPIRHVVSGHNPTLDDVVKAIQTEHGEAGPENAPDVDIGEVVEVEPKAH